MSVADDLKLFGMHNLILESNLRKLEDSGIQIEHVKTIKKAEVIDVELFEQDILKEARKMADFYELYYSLENSIRRLIAERLSEKHGTNWWIEKVPEGVQKAVKEKQQDERDTTMSIRSEDPLSYTNFGELISIFDANWDNFYPAAFGLYAGAVGAVVAATTWRALVPPVGARPPQASHAKRLVHQRQPEGDPA